MEYGLIGEKLKHSFSKKIHGRFAGYKYVLRQLHPQEFDEFMRAKKFKAINVTIPYKQAVLPFCDELDESAQQIGAVNTIVNTCGKLVGYNTDYAGMKWLLGHKEIELQNKTVLILGSGGTCKTAFALAKACGAKDIYIASRNYSQEGSVSYKQANALFDVQVVINTSPLGMYPNNLQEPLVNLKAFKKLEAVVDAVYNPLNTMLIMQAKRQGIKFANGLGMLVAQAKFASEKFTGETICDDEILKVQKWLLQQTANITLIGMPGSGKTSLGRELAKEFGRNFLDTDKELVRRAGMVIPEIFEKKGEFAFRMLETEAAKACGKESAKIIATGGGIIKNNENMRALKQNGMVLFINCPIENLAVGKDRPLSKSVSNLEKLEEERLPLYRKAADAEIEYDPNFLKNLALLKEAAQKQFAKML